MREHRVQVNDLWHGIAPALHQLDSIARQQPHARSDLGHLTTGLLRAQQAIGEQRSNNRLAFDQGDFTAQSGQHEGIPSEAGGGVEYCRADRAANTHGAGHHLPSPAAVYTAMSQSTLHKIHPHCPRRSGARHISGGRLQAESITAQLQQQVRRLRHIIGQRQVQSAGQLAGGCLQLGRQPFDRYNTGGAFTHGQDLNRK